MSYNRRWKPSKSQAAAYKNQMDEITEFCRAHEISASSTMDSYYFDIGGQRYRVSNHSVEASNACAYVDGAQVRALYHADGRACDVIYIHASKTRLIEIYTKLAEGKILDGRGYER